MSGIRLAYQRILSAVAIPLGFNDRLVQFCDRCGRTRYLSFWADTAVWEAVAGNVNGCHHGAFCVPCFNAVAERKGLHINWKPALTTSEHLSGLEGVEGK